MQPPGGPPGAGGFPPGAAPYGAPRNFPGAPAGQQSGPVPSGPPGMAPLANGMAQMSMNGPGQGPPSMRPMGPPSMAGPRPAGGPMQQGMPPMQQQQQQQPGAGGYPPGVRPMGAFPPAAGGMPAAGPGVQPPQQQGGSPAQHHHHQQQQQQQGRFGPPQPGGFAGAAAPMAGAPRPQGQMAPMAGPPAMNGPPAAMANGVPGPGAPVPGGPRPVMPGYMPQGPPPGMARPMGPPSGMPPPGMGGMGGPMGPPASSSGMPGGPMQQQQQQQQQGGFSSGGAFPPGPPGQGSFPPGPGGPPPFGGPNAGGPPFGGPGMPPPPGSHSMQQSGTPTRAPGQGRIDPTQIPRPVPPPTEPFIFETRINGQHVAPPPSNAPFIVRDRGSASPRLMRATLNAVPATSDLLSNSTMQLGVVVQPLALPDPQDDPIGVVDMGEVGPLRCSSCKAYLNAFMRWTDSGKTFVCNFCGRPTPCPEPYFCYLQPDGRRRDAEERPELCRGTYEVIATKEYMVRPPMPVTHLFVIDVSHTAIASGATAAVCQCVEQVLDSLQGGDNALVGIATFDTSVHFYAVRPEAAPVMMVMPDTGDVYAPMPPTLLAKLGECKADLSALLQSIPGMFGNGVVQDSCGAAAIEAAVQLLQPSGGKVHAFLSVLPTVGMRGIKMRDHSSMVNEKDKQLHLVPQDSTYLTAAALAAEYNVAIDIFMLAQAYMDAATLTSLCSTTGGTPYHYCPFNPHLDQDQLLNDLKWNVSRPQGLEAIMRVRCSNGLDVESYSGNFYKPANSPTDIYLPAVDCDKAILARLNLVEKLQPNTEAYLQSALLYTTTDGARRIRVSTLALPVVDQMGSVFKGADLDSQVMALTRQVAIQLPGNTFAQGRDTVNTRITAILYAYRKYCATSSSAVQLILPEALKLLPLYCLAVLKSGGLRPEMRADERSHWLASVGALGCARTMGLLHARLLPLHRLVEPGMMPEVGLPQQLQLSGEVLEGGGVYVMENGSDMLLYFDREASDGLVKDLLGLSSIHELLAVQAPILLQPRDTPASRILHDLLTRLRLDRCAYMRLRVAKKGDPHEPMFLNLLLEDRTQSGVSYVEYLCHVHRQIQQKMT